MKVRIVLNIETDPELWRPPTGAEHWRTRDVVDVIRQHVLEEVRRLPAVQATGADVELSR